MKSIAVALIVLSACFAVASPLTETQYQGLFTKWVEQFDKQYEVKEFFARYSTFKSNLDGILAHNAKGLNWTMAMNEFGDMSPAEFKAKMTGLLPVKNTRLVHAHHDGVATPLVTSVDWRKQNAVTPVKNQGQCGSCWSFSAIGAIEGAWAIKNKNLVSLSEQQLVDCAGSAGNQGCNGGLMDNAFKWVISNGGLCTEAAYPYRAVGGSCKTSCTKVAHISSYKDVTANNENALLTAVTLGPVSVAIEADQSVFQFYSGGVLDSPQCGKQLDHGVLVVGFGTDNGKDYWIVKNSWGSSWGEAGYIRMVRNKNECGIASLPSYPVV